jgi:glutamyl-tRNA synthetase
LLNAKLLHHLDFAAVADRLPPDANDADWQLLRGNLATLADYAGWQPVLDGAIERADLNRDDRLFVREAAQAAEGVDWSAEPWKALTDTLKERTGRKGRALFMPLRLALTGRESGPEMAPLLARIGRTLALARLEAAAQN